MLCVNLLYVIGGASPASAVWTVAAHYRPAALHLSRVQSDSIRSVLDLHFVPINADSSVMCGLPSVSSWSCLCFHTVQVSNMKGPSFPLSFAGSPIKHMAFFVPGAHTLGLFSTILSYNGKV